MAKIFLFLLLGFVLIKSQDLQTIIAGVSIFIVGMIFMEEGFKNFTGGALQDVLQSSTDTVPKSIFTGFFTTAIVQSSSLISLITISFLSAELISLIQGVGIIFGANIGTTATSWIVASFGVKIKISHYAMPIIIFGVIFQFVKSKTYKGVGKILLGLGFIFLGIGYMKEGFETLKAGIDLSQFHIDGFLGVVVYILVGITATIIIQSSSATMAIIIVAVSIGQIQYIDAIALAIGANIGTTVTAVIGSLTSGPDGKRLAVAHLIFNLITGAFAIIAIYKLIDVVEFLSPYIGIGAEDWAMKLTLFHTIFNIVGVLLVSPFISPLVKFLEQLFIRKDENSGKPKYIDSNLANTGSLSAVTALKKESEHLYINSLEIILHGVSLHRTDVFSEKDVNEIIEQSYQVIDIDINKIYQTTVKNLYGEIIKYSTLAQESIDEKDSKYVYSLKIVNRGLVRAIKDIEKVQNNVNLYINHKNEAIKKEYNELRKKLINVLRKIDEVSKLDDYSEALIILETLKEELKEIDAVENGKINDLIREDAIDSKMVTSLINDSIYIYNVANRLIEFAETVWADNEVLREYVEDLEEENETK